jgi:hypothetical protein
MELSYNDGTLDDQAPRTGMTTEDLDQSNGDQGPWSDYTIHKVIAYGSFAAVNKPTGSPGTGTAGAPMYYDGYKWYYVKMMTDINNQPVSLWKRSDGGMVTFRLLIKTNTVVMELDNMGGGDNGSYEVPRTYTGPFNRISMVMGNSTTGKVAYVDQIELRQGHLITPIPTGGCCVRTGLGTGACSLIPQSDCQTAGGDYLGDGTSCGLNGETCDFCPVIFGDADFDGDVDMEDFGLFQRCLTGPGPVALTAECACFDRTKDEDVDSDDFIFFDNCFSAPAVPADPNCNQLGGP